MEFDGGSAQSRGSLGNPAGPSRVPEDVDADKGPDWFMTSCVVVG
jgi:hypothetical protein